MTNPQNSIWTPPIAAPEEGGAGRSTGDITEWRRLNMRVCQIGAANNWSKAEAARRIGMAEGTFHQWLSGSYAGRFDTMNTRVAQWLAAVEEMEGLAASIPESPPFFETRTSAEIINALLYAQMLPELAVITVAAGMGKTVTCEHFRDSRPHVFIATMSPNTRTVHGMLTEIAAAVGVVQHNPAKLHRAIGERLQRNGRKTLLIVDEAQNLCDQAIDQVRGLLDQNRCGIALVGNEEIYTRFTKRQDGPAYAQIKRRFGKRLRRAHPYPEDIEASIDAWGVTDPAARKLLTGIGNKPGALGQIDKTMRLAGQMAAGAEITERLIRAAWSNRAVED